MELSENQKEFIIKLLDKKCLIFYKLIYKAQKKYLVIAYNENCTSADILNLNLQKQRVVMSLYNYFPVKNLTRIELIRALQLHDWETLKLVVDINNVILKHNLVDIILCDNNGNIFK